MLCDLNLWRAQIGMFYGSFRSKYKTCNHKITKNEFILAFAVSIIAILKCFLEIQSIVYILLTTNIIITNILFFLTFPYFLIFYFLLICGDIESNPGPKNKGQLSVMH